MGRYATKTPPTHTTWDAMLAVWREADSIERFEAAWTWDQLHPLRGDLRSSSLEGWLRLTALPQATERIGFGRMVSGMHFRQPSITAKDGSDAGHHLRREVVSRPRRRLIRVRGGSTRDRARPGRRADGPLRHEAPMVESLAAALSSAA